MRAFRHIAMLGAEQHAVVTTAQMGVDSAVTRRAVAAGLLYPKYRGVYGLSPDLTREGEWLAAVLAAGEGAGLTGLCQAALRKVSRFEPTTIEVAVPRQRRPQPGIRLIRALDLEPRDVRVFNAIPVTTVERMLIDLTDTLQAEQIAWVIHEAAYRKWFSPSATRSVMGRTSKRRMTRLERAIEMHEAGSAGTKSDLEDRFLALARSARISEPIINTHLHGIEVDFRWDRLCVWVDRPNHTRSPTYAKDLADQAALEALGFTVLRFTEAAIDLEPRLVLQALQGR
jgi:very-short-patch-repair endonuclease